jgi:hypothetical protein
MRGSTTTSREAAVLKILRDAVLSGRGPETNDIVHVDTDYKPLRTRMLKALRYHGQPRHRVPSESVSDEVKR